jgi:branched-chain amino acid transport system permease protein
VKPVEAPLQADLSPHVVGLRRLLSFSRAQKIAFVVMVALLVIAPWFVYPIVLMRMMCIALFACAFNLLLGRLGMLSFGHAAFLGFGAYVGGWVAQVTSGSVELAILSGGLSAALIGLVIGGLAVRRQGIYFAMVTLALAQMVYFVCVQAPFTGGDDGMRGIPRGHLFGTISLQSDTNMYIFTTALFLLMFLLVARIVYSPFGQVLRSIKDNEARAISLGYDVRRYKIAAFTCSAALAGIAGATKAIVFGVASLTDVHFMMSGEVVLMTVLGGTATLFGPVVGALVVIMIEHYLAAFGFWFVIIQGVIFMVCVLSLRGGLVGYLADRLKVRL